MKRSRIEPTTLSFRDQIIDEITADTELHRAIAGIVDETLKLDISPTADVSIREIIRRSEALSAFEQSAVRVLSAVLAKRKAITCVPFEFRMSSTVSISALNDDCLAALFRYMTPLEQIQNDITCKQWHRNLRLQWQRTTVIDLPKYKLDSQSKALEKYDSILRLIGGNANELILGSCRALCIDAARIAQIVWQCPKLTRLIFRDGVSIQVFDLPLLAQLSSLEFFELTTRAELQVPMLGQEPNIACNCDELKKCKKFQLRAVENCCSKCVVDTALAITCESLQKLRQFHFNGHREDHRTQRRFLLWLPENLEHFSIVGDIPGDVLLEFLRTHGRSLKSFKSRCSWILANNNFGVLSTRLFVEYCSEKLEHLTVYPRLSIEGVEKLRGLRKLNLEANCRSTSVLNDRQLALICAHNPFLLTLRLGRLVKDITPAGFEVIGSLRDLRSLSIDRTGEDLSHAFNDEDVRSIINVATNAQNVMNVRLIGLKALTDETLVYLVRECPQLKKVYVTNCKQITPAGVLTFMDTWSELQKSGGRRLHLRICNCEQLTDVKLHSPPNVRLEQATNRCGL